MLTAMALIGLGSAAPAVVGQGAFTTATGWNACSTACGCQDAQCSNIAYPFSYAGKFAAEADCQATCTTSANCSIFVYSKGSQHCFHRLDGKWEVVPAGDITSGCDASKIAGCGSHPAPKPKPKPTPPSPTPPPQPFVPSNASNMNGEYVISLTPKGKAAADKFPLHFKDYPRGVEYFDVHSPTISSLYSQVFWTGLPPVDLPADIVARYAGRGMAVVGFEVDQVRPGAGPNGEDVPLPINVAYNHHFESGMSGAKSRFEKIAFDGPDDPRIAELEKGMAHGIPNHKEHWVLRETEAAPGGIPSSQSFSGGNGGEYRKSFHGYPPSYAQVIYSPERFQFTPMQIDTWHREKMNLTGSPFVQGPVPRNAWSPKTGSPDSLYSGLLECPVTTRLHKVISANYATESEGQCGAGAAVASFGECFDAVTKMFGTASNTYVNHAIDDTSMPSGCSASADAADPMVYNVYFNSAKSAVQCGGEKTQLAGATASLVNLTVAVDAAADKVTITMVGPASAWYGVGFNASAMKDGAWAVIAGGDSKVSEYKLSDQGTANKLLAASVTVQANTVIGATRTLVVTRPLKGAGPDYFNFDPAKLSVVPFLNAIGKTPTLSYHQSKVPTTIAILAAGVNVSGTCLCTVDPPAFGSAHGQLVYHPVDQPGEKGQGTVSFGNHCPAEPAGDLLAEKNPTCDVRAYVGGQIACHHMWSLLDADQQIPWVDKPLEYVQKFRFWVQPYDPEYHTTLAQTKWGIGSPVEYDVPKCDATVRGCSKDPATGRWVFTNRGTYHAGGEIVAAHFHCHAPTCKKMSMYTCPPGLVSGTCNETTGTLICTEEPVYGGTGQIKEKEYDEPGFILQPPCMWGSAEFGLEPPVKATGLMFSTKEAWADYGHHGEMAWQQMYLAE